MAMVKCQLHSPTFVHKSFYFGMFSAHVTFTVLDINSFRLGVLTGLRTGVRT